MGTTVLNGTSWPLNRTRMADYLGFAAMVDNAYDASQIASMDHPVEVGAIVTSIALHVGNFIEDMMTQYAQARPWILLQEGGDTTYVSSAMPQKRNPGILNNTRRDAKKNSVRRSTRSPSSTAVPRSAAHSRLNWTGC
jgi:argininosuccinate lyase